MYPKIKHIYDPASIITLVLLILFLLPNRSLGQDSLTSEIGIPFIQSFTPEDYQASTQNWDIVQDSIGFIYIGFSSPYRGM